ncbi:MAG: hypothetical protein FJZ60_04605 [Chlamydiae bacterium]|nr:hypothetical protein [Chlamydiota bacterium]
MVIQVPLFLVLAVSNFFPKYKAFWFNALLGLVADLFVLSLPLGVHTFFFALMSLVCSSVKPHLPPLGSFWALPSTFFFFFLFSLMEVLALRTFGHLFEDLLLGPLFDTGVFLLIVVLGKWSLSPKKEVENEAD